MPAEPAAVPRIAMRAIRKAFPGVLALDGVDLALRPGEVHALLGENGAGKSTLIKILTGAVRRDSGEMWLDGQPIDPGSTGEAQAAGISTVFQEVNLIPTMSVTKNMALERAAGRFGMISWRKAREQARAKLARLGVDIDIERPLGSFSVAVQQLVAIARALEDNTRVLVLDEPTASLDAKETTALFSIMRELKARGIAVVFITHFLEQVYEVGDRITVLRNGRLVGTAAASDVSRPDLVSMMIGRELGEVERAFSEKDAMAAGPVRLSARGLGRKRVLEPFDLILRQGEVVGLAGLLGSGRTETAKMLFGAISADAGELTVMGTPTRNAAPRQSLRAGIAFCPEDRKAEGLVAELSVRENIMLSIQSKQGWLKRIPRRRQDELAREMIAALGIATPDAEKPVGQLSGGNQQKVVLARALASNPSVLLLDEPTRGIDVGAHAEIIKLIRKLCKDGLALLVASSELDELVAATDRVAVLRDRAKIGEISGEQITRDNIVRMIAGDDGRAD
ncbi:sugar ABC transporter ATP-binding protein [Aquibium carbonis]|uniref:Sugar ABC transporter ATP-binding protein n=1 Tax=Aquibium carbonis TaxID=2495581 RepID=A0A429YPY9_9HYPH|nr:sugar ABC transporter ATP-binding protein [Aquibium carbonis]RST83499.1 sugar ABC transporter ATP-binding protein [Aquibium carbonis]